MRKIVANFFISLDGVVESPDRWHFPYFDEQMGAAIGAGMASSDAMLMGRRTYEEWAAYWPTSTDEPFASQLNGCASTSSPPPSRASRGATRRWSRATSPSRSGG